MASTLATASRRAATRLPQHLLLLNARPSTSVAALAHGSHSGSHSAGGHGGLLLSSPDAASSSQRRPPSSQPPSHGGLRARTSPVAEYHTSHAAEFRTKSGPDHSAKSASAAQQRPGSIAFGECEISALSDLFHQFAKTDENDNDGEDIGDVDGSSSESSDASSAPTTNAPANTPYLSKNRVRLLLESIGERPSEATFKMLLDRIDSNRDGRVTLEEFLSAADLILGKSPARVVLVVGGPGSGKGALCERLAAECGAVHLSCGEMLREEVESGTPLGLEVAGIMERGELVSSATVTALMRRRMRAYPGRRILLDGFPRSLENARDFVELCGPPELALHLDCDDTVLLERILDRGEQSAKEEAANGGSGGSVRSDDNVHTAINRLRTYHKHHDQTMQWLKKIKVPIVELDCSGTKDDVWGHLSAIGRLMRPAVQVPQEALEAGAQLQQQQQQQERQQQERQQSGNDRSGAGRGDMEWFA